MRTLFLDVVGTVVISIVLVCAALGMLPGDPSTTWFGRTDDLLRTAFTLRFKPSVFAVIVPATALSLAIIGTTALSLILIGLPLGVLSVTRSRSPAIRLLRNSVNAVSSLPVLVLGTVTYVVLGREFGVTLRQDTSFSGATAAAIGVLILGDRLLADIVQRVEIGTRAVLAEPYLRTVRAASLGYRRHLLQSLVPPVAEAIAARSMFLISGAIVAELVFFVHGLGFTVEHNVATANGDRRLILASSMALIAIGVCFRVAHRGAIAVADARRRT